MLQFLIVVISLILPFGQLITADDPCRLSNLYNHNNETKDGKPVMRVEIPQGCIEGQFDWDWPQGYIYLSLSNTNQLHSLCVEINTFSIAMLGGVTDVTNEEAISLELPTNGHPACSVAVKGKAELLIEAVKHQLYWTSFGYRVNLL